MVAKKKSALPTLLAANAIAKLNASAISSITASQDLLHNAAIQCLMHAEKHGDVTLMGSLIEGVRTVNGAKAHAYLSGLTAWVRDYSPIYSKGKGNYGQRDKGDPLYKPYDLEKAAVNPFWAHEAMPVGKDNFTIADVIKLVTETPEKRLRSAMSKDGFDIPPAQLAKLWKALQASKDAFGRVMGADGEVKVNADLAEPKAAKAPASKAA